MLPATVVPFVLVLYLSLQGGGYDTVVRGEVGIVVWWVVLLGALVGLFPIGRLSRAAWIGLTLLAVFAAWTAVGVSWSESSERSVEEVARISTHLGLLALAIAIQGRDGWRRMLIAVTAAIAVVGLLALLSRLQPGWFPADEPAHFLSPSQGRLNYPLDYWNGVAALMAIGMPLALIAAHDARHLWARALAAAVVPVMALAAFYTFSRGGAVETAAAIAVLLILHPGRIAFLPTLGIAAAGSALVIAAATRRDELEDGLTGAVAARQGDEMLALVLIVCAGVALLRVGLARVQPRRPRRWPRLEPGQAATMAGATAVAAIILALAAGAPEALSNAWDDFKDPVVSSSGAERFESASGTGRYQQWQSAIDANASSPFNGIGPGTYEYWWAREGPLPGFIRDAHSLYLETLAELGLVGFTLITGFMLLILVVGTRRALSSQGEGRAWLAGSVAACFAFAVAAGIDWAWELTALPAAFLVIAGAILGSGGGDGLSPLPMPRRLGTPAARAGLALLAVPALIVIAIPLAATSLIRESQAHVRAGEPAAAIESAADARDLQPYAAAPELQLAVVLELTGDLDGAAAAARDAIRKEEVNWRTWLTLSRIEAQRGRVKAAAGAYREAVERNPLIPALLGVAVSENAE